MASRIRPMAVRAWQGGQRPSKRRRRRKAESGFVFVFDTETTVDASQRLRVGCYRMLGSKGLVAEGLFYGEVSPDELRLLENYADARELTLHSLEEFREWLHRYVYRLRATVVGFNLPFDLPTLAVDWSPARAAFNGGWSLTIWRTRDGEPRTASVRGCG